MAKEVNRSKRVRGPITLRRHKKGWAAVDDAWVYMHPSGRIEVVVLHEGRRHIVELPPRIARMAATQPPKRARRGKKKA